jgi:hypothetical protein
LEALGHGLDELLHGALGVGLGGRLKWLPEVRPKAAVERRLNETGQPHAGSSRLRESTP